MKKYVFLSGIPRSGSTLLANILSQNPDLYATPTSGILSMMLMVKHQWDKQDVFRAIPTDQSEGLKMAVLRGMLDGYFSDVDQRICVDKSRGWPAHLEMATMLLGWDRAKVKCLCTVRDVRDVLASFEQLYRMSSTTMSPMAENPKAATAAGRVETLLDREHPLGRSIETVSDSLARGWSANIHFVEYDKLTAHPELVLHGIYNFLGEPTFKHEFEYVDQVTEENDMVYGFRNLHKIRTKVEPIATQWPSVFDKLTTFSPIWKEATRLARFWET